MRKILLTGDRPTGPLHIGHLFGSLLSRRELQDQYESYIMIADVQALTDNFENPQKVHESVYEVAADNLAIGLDPEKVSFFIQSQIPQIAELTVFYSNLVTVNTLRRNPTVKAEIAQKQKLFGQDGESVTYGFLGYPVSQAADITFVRGEIVPVGKEQLLMIEQEREIVENFHRIYNCNIFPIPQAKLSPGSRILGLDGKTKMSKSLNNTIFLKDTPEDTVEKLKTAKTDSERRIDYDPENRPEISNLVLIYSIINNIKPAEAITDLENQGYNSPAKGYGHFKAQLADNLNGYLKPIRERRKEITADPSYIKNILETGRDQAIAKAEETMALVRSAMQINY